VEVQWRIATDTAMTNVLQTGTVMTDATKDYTVKVDVTGLQPSSYYFYEFTAYQRHSVRGRTKTLPALEADIDSLRFGMVSCASMGHGYYNAYSRLTARNDVDAILHLGDYIYEYGNGEFGSVRDLQPPTEILDLSDYRMRHSHYKLDPDLRGLHQQYPFITVWDDHETANDSWYGGAANHDPATEGDWFARKSAGVKAYFEWMPIRKPDPNDDERIYRRMKFGKLAELHMLDTRLEAREEQTTTVNNSPTRTLLGTQQYTWLIDGMRASDAQWQVLGQQVMMAPIQIFNVPINMDQWDGYPAERNRLYNDVMTSFNFDNLVVLTGDIHTSWAHDLPRSNYVPSTGANSVGVEFVVTSVTSTNFNLPVPLSFIQSQNPHNKFADLTNHGYMVLDINKQRTQADWYNVDVVEQVSTNESFRAGWQTIDGSRHLTQASAASVPHPHSIYVQAPLPPRPFFVATQNAAPSVVIFGAYPNPTIDRLDLQYFIKEKGDYTLRLADATGKILTEKRLSNLAVDMYYDTIDLAKYAAGVYYILLSNEKGQYSKRIVKTK
jgi:alkaline phosphatase D